MTNMDWMDELKTLLERCPKDTKAVAVAFDSKNMLRVSSCMNLLEYIGILEMECRVQHGVFLDTLRLPEHIERYRIIDKPEEPKP